MFVPPGEEHRETKKPQNRITAKPNNRKIYIARPGIVSLCQLVCGAEKTRRFWSRAKTLRKTNRTSLTTEVLIKNHNKDQTSQSLWRIPTLGPRSPADLSNNFLLATQWKVWGGAKTMRKTSRTNLTTKMIKPHEKNQTKLSYRRQFLW